MIFYCRSMDLRFARQWRYNDADSPVVLVENLEIYIPHLNSQNFNAAIVVTQSEFCKDF